jgi:hypothetical protein
MFGFSATPTRLNSDVIAEDRFVDTYIEQGALFGWMFQYIPIGLDPDVNLMATPQQRDRIRQATKRWQVTKPIFVGDFWNDGACVGGCLSASKYCYVAADGTVQPCTFVHFTTHNAKDATLTEIFQSKFFREIRAMQPYHKNLLRPCKIIDHPQDLRDVVERCGAQPTYPGADAIIRRPDVIEHLDRYSAEYGKLADAAWQGDVYNQGRSVLVPFLGRINVYDIWPKRMQNADDVTANKAAAEVIAHGGDVAAATTITAK